MSWTPSEGPPEEEERFARPQPMMLINEISRLMGDRIRRKGYDNPIGQHSGRLLMMALSHKEGVTQLDLVRETHLKAPTISVALHKLEQDGFVMRVSDSYDMRAVRVYLTDRGRALNNRIRQCIMEEETAATSILTEVECRTLTALLKKIRSNILETEEKGEEI